MQGGDVPKVPCGPETETSIAPVDPIKVIGGHELLLDMHRMLYILSRLAKPITRRSASTWTF